MDLVLGTALWGWTIAEPVCFDILDEFYRNGFRKVDTATNYPINKNPGDFRFAETVIKKWIDAHKVDDLKITIKVASVNNSGAPDNNLSYSFLLMSQEYYLTMFETSLDTFMIHWDSRSDELAISETIRALQIIKKKCAIGLSGIKEPGMYFEQVKKDKCISSIQIKHNMFQSDYEKYRQFHDAVKFSAYGLNGGGLKMDNNYTGKSSTSIRHVDVSHYESCLLKLKSLLSGSEVCNSFNDLAMIFAFHSYGIDEIISGTSSRSQMIDTIESFNNFSQINTDTLYRDLVNTLK